MLRRIVSGLRGRWKAIGPTKLNSIYLAGAQYIISFLGAIKGIVLAKILGPTLVGEVAAVTLVLNYGTNLHFGSLEAMNRNVPYYRSRSEWEHAEKTKNSTFTFSLFNGLVAAFAVVVFALLKNMAPFYKFGIIVFALAVPSYFVYNFQLCLLRYQNNFKTIAVFQIVQSLFAVSIAVVGCFFISNYAVVIGAFFSYWVVIFLYLLSGREKFTLQIDWKALKEVLKLGLPLFSLGFAATLIATIDRVVILNYMDSTQLGLYTFPLSMAVYYSMAGTAANSVVFQKMVSDYGKNQDQSILSQTVQKSVILLVLFSPIIGFLLEGATRFLIDWFLPAYMPSKAIVAILIIPAFFKSTAPFFNSGLITMGKPMIVLRNQIVLIFIITALNLFLVGYLKLGIEGVAYSTAVSFIAYFIMQFYSFHRYRQGKLGWYKWQPFLMIGLLILIHGTCVISVV